MTRSSQPSPLDGLHPPHGSTGASLAPPPPLSSSTLRSSHPLGMYPPPPLSSLPSLTTIWPFSMAFSPASIPSLALPLPSSAATTAHLATPSSPETAAATAGGYVGTVAWRRSIYERGLYAQPAGAARGRRVAAAAAAAAGGRHPSAARLRWGAGECIVLSGEHCYAGMTCMCQCAVPSDEQFKAEPLISSSPFLFNSKYGISSRCISQPARTGGKRWLAAANAAAASGCHQRAVRVQLEIDDDSSHV
eukprot:1150587-Pelagomonas_calceolata.AAC.1